HPPGDGDDNDDDDPPAAETQPPAEAPEKPETPEPSALRIDLEGIQERVLAFPVPEGRYGQIAGLKGKVLFTLFPLEGARQQNRLPSAPPPARGKLQVYNFDDLSHDTLIHGVSHFTLSMDGKTLLYRAGNRLRALKAGEKPPRDGDEPGRKTGWLDLGRLKVLVEPQAEWEQMYREAWRLQRDNFWTEDMSGVDWQAVYRRYFPLLRRIATRTEFSDLLWEMQGELGTSHAYEMGGDYPPEPDYPQGFLAADFRYDPDTDSYRLTHIVQGDNWTRRAASPLAKPGLNLKPGDRLLAINGRRVGRDVSPQELLLNQAGNEVLLTFAPQNGGEPRSFPVKTLYSEFPARYREWVETNRRRVHEATGGRVGYIHIPDMGADGYAEFHRGYLAEVEREGLIVDVRNNRGGNVSSLILEKLARRHLGYDIRRYGDPLPYPPESAIGPMVALCNQYSASDGDMFSHAFKMMGLGPLIGVRTWGGVIGIDFRDTLVDGGLTTQPAYSFYFKDVGWKVENYGVEPDIEVEIRPQDYVAGRDPQLERAIEEILRRLEENPPTLPDFGGRPNLSPPELPAPA
ncbi:MAG: peptidase, partial [Caldilineae bacterium]